MPVYLGGIDPPTDFEWDEAKAERNVAKHGVSFDEALAAFTNPGRVVIDTTREVDQEARSKLVGEISGFLFTVVFTTRGDACRIISARRSNRAEEKAYDGR